MSLISLRVYRGTLLIQKWSDQRSRDGKIDVSWVDHHLTFIFNCHRFDGFLIGVRLDKAMDLVRIDVLKIVIVDLHPGVLQDFFGRNTLVCLFMEQFLKEKSSGSAHMIWKL